MKRRILISAGALVGLGWLLAFVVLGLRRWGCSLPWRQDCITAFQSQAERAILFLWVTDRETLVSAGLAVAAAGVGAWFLHRQIRQSDRQDRERRKREHRAARAMLPLALSEVCDFAQAHAREWLRLREHGRRVDDADPGEVIEPIEPDFPRVREETLQIFRQIIASAPRR